MPRRNNCDTIKSLAWGGWLAGWPQDCHCQNLGLAGWGLAGKLTGKSAQKVAGEFLNEFSVDFSDGFVGARLYQFLRSLWTMENPLEKIIKHPLGNPLGTPQKNSPGNPQKIHHQNFITER